MSGVWGIMADSACKLISTTITCFLHMHFHNTTPNVLCHVFSYFTVYQPPIITGNTTVNEGDTLSLNCDSSNSNRLPPVMWFNQTHDVVSNTAQLTLPDIMRSQAGNYTCQTSPPNPDNSTSSSVDVVVKCKNHRFSLPHTSCIMHDTMSS